MLNAEGYDYSDDTLAAGLHLALHGSEEHPQLTGYDRRDMFLTAGTSNFITVRVCSLFLALLIYVFFSAIGIIMCPSLRLSVTLCIVALRVGVRVTS